MGIALRFIHYRDILALSLAGFTLVVTNGRDHERDKVRKRVVSCLQGAIVITSELTLSPTMCLEVERPFAV